MLFLSPSLSDSIEIREIVVPQVVESGSEPFVILDCDYHISENEAKGMDIKVRRVPEYKTK